MGGRIHRCALALVDAIAKANSGLSSAFLFFTGDVVLQRYDVNDWKVFDHETSIWRENKISVLPRESAT